jgi:hypothetical protein
VAPAQQYRIQITILCSARFADAYNRDPLHAHHGQESSGKTDTNAAAAAFERKPGPVPIIDLNPTAGLDAFLSEGSFSRTQTPVGEESHASAPTSPELPVSLQALESAGFGFERDEAVALAHSLCDVFGGMQWLPSTPFDREPGAVPRDAVLIDPTGQVVFADVAPTGPEHAIRCVGHTLSELLGGADPLLRARVISRAVSSPPGYESLGALSQALAAYESRDRREVLAQLHRRATGSAPQIALPAPPFRPPATSAPRRPDPAPARVATVLEAVRVQAARWLSTIARLQAARWPSTIAGRRAALCGLVLLAAGFSVWVIRKTTAAPPQAQVVARALPGAEPVVAERVAAAPTPTPIQPKAMPRRATRAKRAPANARPAASTTPHSPTPFPETSTPAAATVPPPLTLDAAAPAEEPTAVRAPRDTGASAAPHVDPSAPHGTYDQSDADVTAPSARYTQLSGILSTQSPGIRTEVLTVAVVVSEDGRVLSVKAVNAPRTIGESLVLFGALASIKAVEFRPATKQGVPVKYRLIVPVRIPSSQQNQ